MKRTSVIGGAMIAALLLPLAANAQQARNAREAVGDNTQIVRDKHEIARDQKEIGEFEKLVSQMDAAMRANSMKDITALNNKLRAAMQREVAQAKGDVARAGREVRQDRREAHGETMEARETGRVRDAAQAIDDRHDKRDDKSDRRQSVGRTTSMSDLLARADALRAGVEKGEAPSLTQNRALLDEFLRAMRADLAAADTELHEDRQERREDRRERRTDRRK